MATIATRDPVASAMPQAISAIRFLNQAGLGATDEQVNDLLRTRDKAAWLAQQFKLPQTLPSPVDWMVQKGFGNCEPPNVTGLNRLIWSRLFAAPDVVRQRITLALSEILVVSAQGLETLPFYKLALASYWGILETHAFGNFRDLLEAVTLSPAMGAYLSMRGSMKEDPAAGRAPDENFARELLQLFSIGLYQLNMDGTVKRDPAGAAIETYGMEDIKGLARALTGWDLNATFGKSPEMVKQPMVLNESHHSLGEKRFLGATIPAGTTGLPSLKIALDAAFKHPNVGPFIGKQFIQKLVKSNPSADYVRRVAMAFESGYTISPSRVVFGSGKRGDMQALIAAVLLDPEARSHDGVAVASNAVLPGPEHGKLREPMLCLVQWARTFRAKSSSATWACEATSDAATKLGQSPLFSPSVFNFFRPGYVPPGTIVSRKKLVAPEFQLLNEVSVTGYLNFMQVVIDKGAGIEAVRDVQPDYSRELALADNPLALVRRIRVLLCSYWPAGGVTETEIVKVVSAIPASSPLIRVKTAIFMVMASPLYLNQV